MQGSVQSAGAKMALRKDLIDLCLYFRRKASHLFATFTKLNDLTFKNIFIMITCEHRWARVFFKGGMGKILIFEFKGVGETMISTFFQKMRFPHKS